MLLTPNAHRSVFDRFRYRIKMLFRAMTRNGPELELRADIAIAIRGHVIRIPVGDPRIHAIIPIAACNQKLAATSKPLNNSKF